MNDFSHAISMWWANTPLYLQIFIIVTFLLLVLAQSLDFGQNLGATLYRILH